MKNSSLWIRTAIILVIALVGIYLVFGPRRVPTGDDFTLAGIKQNLANNINLGLDLKGGSHLVMRVKLDEYLQNLTVNNETAALNAAKEAKDEGGNPYPIGEATHVTQNGNYQINLTVDDPSKAQAVVDAINKKVDFKNSGWLESVSGNTINWSLPVQAQNKLKEQAVDQALKIIDSRINTFGVKEPTLQKVGSAGSGQILLQMPGVEDPERVKQLIGSESHLMLMKVAGESYQTFPTEQAAKQSLGGTVPLNRLVLKLNEPDDKPKTTETTPNKPEKWMILESPAIVDGSELRDAAAFQQSGTDYNIRFNLKPAGAQAFGDWTGKNIGKYLAVVLNNEVKSAPVIKGQIFDTGTIEGKFTKTSGEDLALTLKSGSLPAKLDYQEERTVGPSLGADSIKAGVEASLGGLIFVIVFMLFYYRGAGVNAVIALILNMLLTMAALVVINSTLTLPGIAGLILGIGMAVDSNVLIFERIRE
ncbi:MAG: protein translocase subunit SecD, partial [Actinomycetota bacterium]